MSLENAIQELTAALNAHSEALLQSRIPTVTSTEILHAATIPVTEPVKEVKPEPVKQKAKPAPKPAPVVEPEPEVEDDFDALLDEVDASLDEPAFTLPAGERNAAFYAAHVQPVLQQLGAKDKPALANLVRVQFNAQKGNLVLPSQWDDLVNEANKLLAA